MNVVGFRGRQVDGQPTFCVTPKWSNRCCTFPSLVTSLEWTTRPKMLA
jgi:hypothetical protein